jgi:cytochrome c553
MRFLVLLLGATLLAREASAEDRLALPQNDRWKTECGSCHLAYPPQLLPAESWRRLMSGLDRHFGTDASLEPGLRADIGSFLERYSASGKRARGAGDSLRITETAWFRREHREVTPKNAASCESCHTNAAQGDFHE